MAAELFFPNPAAGREPTSTWVVSGEVGAFHMAVSVDCGSFFGWCRCDESTTIWGPDGPEVWLSGCLPAAEGLGFS